MKAKKKPLDEKTPADYGVDIAPRLKVLKTAEPPKRQAGIKVDSRSPNSSTSSRTKRE